MTQIADLPFTQLVNLNILNELRIQGVLVNPFVTLQIIEVTTAYTALNIDDGISATGTFNINLFPSSNALNFLRIKSVATGGTVTIIPNGLETIDGLTTHPLTPGQSVTLMPVAAGWEVI